MLRAYPALPVHLFLFQIVQAYQQKYYTNSSLTPLCLRYFFRFFPCIYHNFLTPVVCCTSASFVYVSDVFIENSLGRLQEKSSSHLSAYLCMCSCRFCRARRHCHHLLLTRFPGEPVSNHEQSQFQRHHLIRFTADFYLYLLSLLLLSKSY